MENGGSTLRLPSSRQSMENGGSNKLLSSSHTMENGGCNIVAYVILLQFWWSHYTALGTSPLRHPRLRLRFRLRYESGTGCKTDFSLLPLRSAGCETRLFLLRRSY